MAFFRRPDGSYIMHRICRTRPEGCFFVGDAQQAVEGPVPPERIFAVVTKVHRKGRWIGRGYGIFKGIWPGGRRGCEEKP